MTKNDCKGMTPNRIPDEIKQVFATHIEIMGDNNLKWDRLFRFLVMENNRFPNDEPISGICADFFSAVHGGEVERFGSTIEAHLRAFGSWFPRYWQAKTLKRASESMGRDKEPAPVVDLSEPVTKRNWNLMRGLGIDEIRRNVLIMESINQAPDEQRRNRQPITGVSGINNFMARCQESLRRYQIAHRSEGV